ncbi:dynein intermediate chain 3, ciliary-like [Condylostylus longicornis]|uniref:dynein intermediate chain 3, ciliary-like n=1 Tax=Condylostylus longicornis TaxID=2530218 RepID=UPI00244E1946|nr:dynein intermediate chain 3, ciliary-like [Condylostylus longicornis]
MNIFQFTRPRKRFGRQPLYSDRNEVLFDERSNHAYFYQNYVLKNPLNRSTNFSEQFAISEAQTDNVTIAHRSMNHTEGGWPKEINHLDEEQNIRHRKKVEREDNWGKQCILLAKATLHSVAQNAVVNIYENYFSKHLPLELKNDFKAINVQIYHDLKYPTRPVSQVDWTPTEQSRFLAAHSIFETFPTFTYENDFYIWDCHNPLVPYVTLRSPVQATKVKICPKNDNLIAGGLKSGSVALWDARVNGDPEAISPLEVAHQDAVTAFCWVFSKTNTEFYTGSLDGLIRYWDGRNLRHPTFEVYLDPIKAEKQDPGRSHGCTCLEFEYTIPVRFMAGTIKGQLFLGNRQGTTHLECLSSNFNVMDGPIVSIERNIFFVKNFLIIGGFLAKIYSEECKDFPIMRFPQQRYELTCAVWSPARCSVFVTGNMNGNIDFWDVLLDQKVPTFTMSQFRAPISTIAFKRDGKLLAVGTRQGDVYMIKVDEAFTKSGSKDKALLSAMFERELQRVKLLEGRIREINLVFKNAGIKINMDEIYPISKLEEDDVFSIEDDEPEDESDDQALIHNQVIEEIDQEEEIIGEDEIVNTEEVSVESDDDGEEEDVKDIDPDICDSRKKYRNIIQTETNLYKEKDINLEMTVFEGAVEASELGRNENGVEEEIY